MSEIPVNRFWACLFASSLFGLIWTQKMKKTRKWILLGVIGNVMLFGMMILFVIIRDMALLVPDAVTGGVYDDVVLVVVIFAVYGIQPVINIPYMYRWTTQYNITNFGNKSQKDWLKENN